MAPPSTSTTNPATAPVPVSLRPLPVAVLKAELAAGDFHVRFSAIARRYLYRIVNRRAPLALVALGLVGAADLAHVGLYRARRVDKAYGKGALHGLPLGVKDMIDTADMPTERSSR